MAGLLKQKKYGWIDTNLALFGSDLERQVKKEAAETEEAWSKAGKKVGVEIWRIVNFRVTDWPKDEYGKFYNGDSYIILNTYTKGTSDKLLYDVHFWIGKYSTQDEYGTAAYKTVELDTFLDGAPVEHREVQGYESALFKSYFEAITVMEGGADSGFRQVKPEEYVPRLFHFHSNKQQVEVKQIPRCRSQLASTDVYILDMGLKIYQWNGNGANVQEKKRAMQFVQSLANERSGKAVKTEVLEANRLGESHEFYRLMDEDDDHEDVVDSAYRTDHEMTTLLYRVTDECGETTFTKQKEGQVTKYDFDDKDVFILDTKQEVFVWIGKQTTQSEKKNALTYAHRYLQGSDHPFMPVSCFAEGNTTEAFETAIAA